MEISRMHKLIWDAIETARENGYDYTTALEWATDLQRNHAQLEQVDFYELLECVETVLRDPTCPHCGKECSGLHSCKEMNTFPNNATPVNLNPPINENYTPTADEVLNRFRVSRGLGQDPFPWFIEEINKAIDRAIGDLNPVAFASFFQKGHPSPHQLKLIGQYLETRGFKVISLAHDGVQFYAVNPPELWKEFE